MWDNADPDLDDALHNPDPIRDAALDRSFDVFSGRGWANASALFILIAGLITLFAGYPIIAFYGKAPQSDLGASNIGGTNSTGQVSAFSNMPTLIDKDTDSSVYTKTGTDGKTYNLVFSDEFETDGRTFWPGDDPFWEAVDLYYWPTNDIEWFDPGQITTKDGKLVITMVEKNNHNLNFQSGMLQSWNKLCFTTGIIEVSVSLPGSPEAPGFWPGVWTMGNLGRAGYGATTEGTWPYSYDSCDVGTFPNQTNPDGTTPQAALTGSPEGGELSFLPGQRLSACTCPGSDHPGPKVSNGRNVPEIDILEAQVDVSVFRGQASQSYQTAPFNFQYDFDNSSSSSPIYDESITQFNSYKGGQFQQALSAVTYIDASFYNDNAYSPYSFEWWSNPSQRDEGYITWSVNDQKTWTVTAASLAGDTETEISSRIIPEEPMSIILNFGMAPGFQEQDFQHLQFPSEMRIDYVRIYQRDDVKDGLGCDPSSHPTSDYITDHANAYSNPNLTTWAQAGYDFPRNSKYDGC
ncbi:glycoside hydrolase family 16 protein [Stereum hirsutum FP-91666 SS1]|uniref:glycoside hydrolase family 16 protein n=1 Tax=Stereum hirsutum (strain FP-91666) TaxID=721885 RepID=UPI00044106DA|nr:glycoside hydrolase family 16 protein [Stereum hirsutum FP-91666 SS1]EIM86744.1 glycoside hydrolase family 16 protein [Stereum hirsutum FP-91666 SS1]